MDENHNIYSAGIIVGLGVGITRDCSTIMVAQYFKKKREFVEIFVVSGSGCGIVCMSIFYEKSILAFGWRYLQIVYHVKSAAVYNLFFISDWGYKPLRALCLLHLYWDFSIVQLRCIILNDEPFYI